MARAKNDTKSLITRYSRIGVYLASHSEKTKFVNDDKEEISWMQQKIIAPSNLKISINFFALQG